MKVIVIVDMQNDFIDGVLGSPEAKAVVPTMIERLKEYENELPLVIFTKDTHETNYLETQEGKNLPYEHCIRGTDGWCINKEIASVVDHGNFMKLTEHNGRIEKPTFGSTWLAYKIQDILNTNALEEVVLMGVCTDICVISNALLIKAINPEVKITVDASCCAGVSPTKHAAALEVMKSCQINVINE